MTSAGSATALVTALAPAPVLGRTLARFQLSTGFGLAVSPAVITALASHGSAALWGSLAGATLVSAGAVVVERDQVARPWVLAGQTLRRFASRRSSSGTKPAAR
jgi:hypothetical protein